MGIDLTYMFAHMGIEWFAHMSITLKFLNLTYCMIQFWDRFVCFSTFLVKRDLLYILVRVNLFAASAIQRYRLHLCALQVNQYYLKFLF